MDLHLLILALSLLISSLQINVRQAPAFSNVRVVDNFVLIGVNVILGILLYQCIRSDDCSAHCILVCCCV